MRAPDPKKAKKAMTLAHNHNKSPAPVSVGEVSETAKKPKADALVAKDGDTATKASVANGETFTSRNPRSPLPSSQNDHLLRRLRHKRSIYR